VQGKEKKRHFDPTNVETEKKGLVRCKDENKTKNNPLSRVLLSRGMGRLAVMRKAFMGPRSREEDSFF